MKDAVVKAFKQTAEKSKVMPPHPVSLCTMMQAIFWHVPSFSSTIAHKVTLCLGQAPVLLRLAFHDAATHRVSRGDGGANASIQFEFDRPENTGLKRGW